MIEREPHVPGYTRRVDSRRFSVGPAVFAEEESTCGKKLANGLYLVGKFVEKVIRESAAISVFCLLVVWISYFVGVIDRDTLLICNGVLIALLIIAALLKKRSMHNGTAGDQHRVRRPFPRGAILRSFSHPELSSEDLEVTNKIRSVFVTHLVQSSTESKPFGSTLSECNSCVICLLDFIADEPTQHLFCGHYFHPECLNQWFDAQLSGNNINPSCPTCREEVAVSEITMREFMAEVSAPEFMGSQLSRRVHIVFHRPP